RIDNLVVGATYHITTPYGTFDIVAKVAGQRGIDFTRDIGLVPGNFTLALNAGIGPFLHWDSGLPITDALGNTFIGDPNVAHGAPGTRPGHKVFRTAGRNGGGRGGNPISPTRFSVMGMHSRTPPPVAGFRAAPTIGRAPLAVAFTDLSTGVIT